MEIALLIGSGISIPIGLPNTEEITNNIFPPKDIYLASDSHFYYGKPNPLIPEQAEYNIIINEIISFIFREIKKSDEFQLRDTDINYEDLFYIASNIRSYVYGSNRDAVVLQFVKKLKLNLAALLDNFQFGLHEVLNYSVKYIEDMVRINLLYKPTNFDSLSIFSDIYKDKKIENIHIFSLNHDILLEEFFRGKKDFTNGFEKEVNKVKYWDPNEFYKNYRVKLYKLHGSISWFYFIPNNKKGPILFGDIGDDPDFYHTKDPDGKYQWPMGNAHMLIGTYNKILSYTTDSIFSELFYLFQHKLRCIKNLIIIGYGFKDDGINNKIRMYYQDARDIKILIINPENLKQIVENQLGNSYYKQNKIIFLKKSINDISWEELKRIIN